MKKIVLTGLFALLFAGCSSESPKTALNYSLQANEYKMKSNTEGITFAENGVFKSAIDLNVASLLNLFSVNHILDPLRSRVGEDATGQASLLTPFLVSAILSGWSFNPISPKSGGLTFTFTFGMVDEESDKGSIAGPDANLIKSGLVNLMQLVVWDKSAGRLAAFNEVIRNKNDKTATLKIESIEFGKIYDIMLLMGHVERDYGKEDYVYKDAAPTMLAVGFKEIKITGSDTPIKMTMWPLVVYTKFTTTEDGSQTVVPEITNGNPEAVALFPANWTVNWTVEDSCFKYLKTARNTTNPEGNLFISTKVNIDGSVDNKSGELPGNVITGDVNTSGKEPETSGWVYFNLLYTPFSLNDAAWDGVNLGAEGAPRWIIRNGVNDLAQNDNTNFGTAWSETINGNGAVRFTVQPNAVSSVSLDKTSADINVNGTQTLSATINPPGVPYQSINWSSDDTSVATVSYSGLIATVTGNAAGTATITVTVTNNDGSQKTATCAVTVKVVAVTGVSLSPSTLTLEVGKASTLSAAVSPNNATNKIVSWSSNDISVATVSSSGRVDGVKAGTATITVTTADGNKTATCAVTVTPPAVSSVSLSNTSVNKGESKPLSPTISPTGAVYQSISWSSGNTSVATVDSNGKVYGVKAGETAEITVTITNTNGTTRTAKCTVTVNAPAVTKVTLDKTSAVVNVDGADLTLKATIDGLSGVEYKSVSWGSSDLTKATVSGNGLDATVTGKENGTVTISVTVTSYDGTTKYASCSVRAARPVTGISFAWSTTTVTVAAFPNTDASQHYYLYPTKSPYTYTPWEHLDYQSRIWTSSDTNVVTVADIPGAESNAARLTIKKAGTATITMTVTNWDGSKVTKDCNLTVVKKE